MPSVAAHPAGHADLVTLVDRLAEMAQAARVADYVSAYPSPRGTGVTIEDAVAAVREVREAS